MGCFSAEEADFCIFDNFTVFSAHHTIDMACMLCAPQGLQITMHCAPNPCICQIPCGCLLPGCTQQCFHNHSMNCIHMPSTSGLFPAHDRGVLYTHVNELRYATFMIFQSLLAQDTMVPSSGSTFTPWQAFSA